VGRLPGPTRRLALVSRLSSGVIPADSGGASRDQKQVSALSQMFGVHVPMKREGAWRVWLIYSEIRKTTSKKTVRICTGPSRRSSYLAPRARQQKAAHRSFLHRKPMKTLRRARALLTENPVKDPRAIVKDVDVKQCGRLKKPVDNLARLMAAVGPAYVRVAEIVSNASTIDWGA